LTKYQFLSHTKWFLKRATLTLKLLGKILEIKPPTFLKTWTYELLNSWEEILLFFLFEAISDGTEWVYYFANASLTEKWQFTDKKCIFGGWIWHCYRKSENHYYTTIFALSAKQFPTERSEYIILRMHLWQKIDKIYGQKVHLWWLDLTLYRKSENHYDLYPVHLLVIPMYICTSQSLFSQSYVASEWQNRHSYAQIDIGIRADELDINQQQHYNSYIFVATLRDCFIARLRDCCVARLRDCCVARLRLVLFHDISDLAIWTAFKKISQILGRRIKNSVIFFLI
jgi:hypothetical protein